VELRGPELSCSLLEEYRLLSGKETITLVGSRCVYVDIVS